MEEQNTNTDTKYWKAFQAGDRSAFAFLLDQYYQDLLKYGRRLVQNEDLAKDCLHDLFVNLWSHRKQLDLPISIKAYLLSSYRRELLKTKRRNFWSISKADINEYSELDVQFNIESYLIENEIENETLLKLKQNLSNLSKRQREVLFLRFNEELEYESISKIMNINQHSAINLVYEALKILRKNWVLVTLITLFVYL